MVINRRIIITITPCHGEAGIVVESESGLVFVMKRSKHHHKQNPHETSK